MQTSKKGLIELAGHEGIALSKYYDSVGIPTVGIGATSTEIPDLALWPLTRKITLEEAFTLFKSSIRRYEKAINQAIPNPIPQHQFDALVSWCYNVGTGWAKKATVIRLINQGERKRGALYAALMQFNKPPEIKGRRKKEAILLSTGNYSNNGIVTVFPVSTKGTPLYGRGKNIDATPYIPDPLVLKA